MSSLLKVSEAASLALHASAVMASARGQRTTNERIASILGVSEAHLSKVLQRLTRAGLVRGTRGPGGGFSLVFVRWPAWAEPPRRGMRINVARRIR